MKPLYVKKNGVVYKISGSGIPSIYPATNVEYDNTVTSELQATDVQGAIDELSTRQDINTKNTAYGTCDTAGNVKDKVATLVNATNWLLEVGTIVGVRFTYTNTYTPSSGNNITLNVNNTGAKNIRYSDGTWTSSTDTKCPTAYGEANQTIYYMYDGTYWVWVSHSKDNDTLYNFVGREFRSCNFNDAGLETGFGGDANLMIVNGVYYYNSNGPSTSIGASANDGSVFVHVCDDGYVVQIAQNYETGNIFVRAMNDNVWGAWKKPIANITGNNTVLTTDKTPFLTRQTLNPTGFSGYVREKLVGASYAWNQLIVNGDFSNGTTGWSSAQANISIVSGALYVDGTNNYPSARPSSIPFVSGHKYLLGVRAKGGSGGEKLGFNNQVGYDEYFATLTTTPQWYYAVMTANATGDRITAIYTKLSSEKFYLYDVIFIDLTLAFGSTIADYLYSLTNNGGITKLRDIGFPIDKYTPYGYGLYSVKTSGKKIVGKNLANVSDKTGTGAGWIFSGVSGYFPKANYAFSFDLSNSTSQQIQLQIRNSDDVVVGSIVMNVTNGHNSATFTSNDVGDNIRLYVNSAGTYANFQLEIGTQATTYEKYTETTYPLGNDELRGKFDLVDGEIVASGDVKESNGGITRKYKLINLGSIEWQYLGSGGNERFLAQSAISDIKAPSNNEVPNALCANYTVMAYTPAFSTNKSFAIYSDGKLFVKDSAYTDATVFKTAMNGVYALCELATSTTEQSTPFADPMSLVGATTEEYIDTRDIPCPVGAERQYMGQSEDIIEIPSMPQSDGIRYMKAITSGGKTQLVWEDEDIEDVSSYFTEGICNDFEVGAVRYGRIISFNMACTPIGGGDYIAVIRTYVPAYITSRIGPINVCGQSGSGLHVDAVIDRHSDLAARIKFYTNETLPANEKIYVSGSYICDIRK